MCLCLLCHPDTFSSSVYGLSFISMVQCPVEAKSQDFVRNFCAYRSKGFCPSREMCGQCTPLTWRSQLYRIEIIEKFKTRHYGTVFSLWIFLNPVMPNLWITSKIFLASLSRSGTLGKNLAYQTSEQQRKDCKFFFLFGMYFLTMLLLT